MLGEILRKTLVPSLQVNSSAGPAQKMTSTLPIIRATSFLISQRSKSGWWRDFDTLAGPSDEWVTAYIGSWLAAIDSSEAKQAARMSWTLLRHRRWWSAGWGYNATVPADADTTLLVHSPCTPDRCREFTQSSSWLEIFIASCTYRW